MPRIGPYQFTTMDGRFQIASQPSVVTVHGLVAAKSRPRPAMIRTVEDYGTFVGAWQQALAYRMAIGALTDAVDDGGILVTPILVNDCRTQVRANGDGTFALETQWTLIPGVGWGTYGQAQQFITTDGRTARWLSTPAANAPASALIQVGGVAFDTATGDLQWPIDPHQRTDVQNSATAIGAETVAQPPSLGGGTLTCVVGVADEATAFDIMRSVSSMVGIYVSVQLGGVTIAPCAVEDVAVDWTPSIGQGGGRTRTMTVVWTINTQDDNPSGSQTVSVAVVQVAKTWGAWKTLPDAVCLEASEGVGAASGQASWSQVVGTRLAGGKAQTTEPTDYGGQWCRLCLRTNDAGKPDVVGKTLTPIWWGVCLASRIISGQDLPTATMLTTAAGVMHAFHQVWMTRWYEDGQVGRITDPGEVLPFNGRPGGDKGSTLAGPALCPFPVHDRNRTDASGNPAPQRFFALDAVQAIVNAVAQQYPDGPNLTIGGQTDALNYVGAWNLAGHSATDMLAEILSPRFGITFQVVPTDAGVTLRISTIVASPVTIPGGAPLPANDRAAILSLVGTDVTSCEVRRERSQQADNIIVEGAKPWGMISLGIFLPAAAVGQPADFDKGWSPAAESDWATADDVKRSSDKYAQVWRRFVVAKTYQGESFFVRSNQLFQLGRTLGPSGESGEFEAPTVGLPKPATVQFTRQLPMPVGLDLANSVAYEPLSQNNVEYEGPLLFGRDTNGNYENLTDRWQIQFDQQGGAVTLGRNIDDAKEIKAYLEAKKVIILTTGVVYPIPWRETWRRNKSLRPRGLERTVVLSFPDMVFKRVFEQTLIGLVSKTEPTKFPLHGFRDFEKASIPGNPGVRLDPLLALAQLIYTDPAISIAYTRKAMVDVTDATAPGALITDCTVSLGPVTTGTPNQGFDGPPTQAERQYTQTAANAVRTARSWSFKVDELSTSYGSDRLLPGFDRFVFMPLQPNTVNWMTRAYG